MELNLDIVEMFRLEDATINVTYNPHVGFMPIIVFKMILGVRGLALKIFLESTVRNQHRYVIATSVSGRSGTEQQSFTEAAINHLTKEAVLLICQMSKNILNVPLGE